MLTEDKQIPENSIISSEEINKYFFNTYSDISKLFDENFETLGKTEILSMGLKLIDSSNKKTIEYLYSDRNKNDGYEIEVNCFSQVIYPATASNLERAEIMPEFNQIVNKIINKKNIFSLIAEDDSRQIKPGVSIGKSSNNFVFLSKPEAVFESNIKDILTGEYPYFIRFIGSQLEEANVIIEITNLLENNTINLIEYSPYPQKGLMEIENIMVNNEYIQNKSGTIQYLETSNFQRSEKNFIPFVPVKGNKINVSIANKKRINSLNSVIVGVELIEVYQVTYASKSYFGYKLTLTENKKLTGIDFIGKWHSSSIEGVTAKIYETKEDFNAMNNNYVLNIDSIVSGSLNMLKEKDYFILFTMTLEENMPQTIEKVGIRFE